MRLCLLLLLVAFPPRPALAASNDNHVDASGVSHIAWQDRVPRCPRSGEAFQVRFQAWRNDLTSASVTFTYGANVVPVNAAVVATRGPYEVWAATSPNPGSTAISYVIQLVDGSDTEYLGPSGLAGSPPAPGFAIDYTTYAHAPTGATLLSSGGSVFKVWSPTTSSARVRGAWDWTTGVSMTRAGEYWTAIVPQAVAGTPYKFFFNNATWNTDPRARRLDAANGPYNAVVVNPDAYAWAVPDFATPALEDMVIYQLHVGTFCGRNDPYGAAAAPNTFADVSKRIAHLADLGVNAVQLCPVDEFPGDLSGGYNPITMWSPEWKYGTPDQFRALVDSCHVHGIAVLLDVVWNHVSTNDNFLWNYDGTQQWFDSPTAVDTPWGSQADFDKLAVRDYYADAALHWLAEYKIDGYRMDATYYMAMYQGSGWGLMQRFNDEIDNRWADKVALAEQLPDDAAITKPTALGGAGFDSQYYGGFRDAVRNAVLGGVAGDPNVSAVGNAIQGGGAYLNGRSALDYFQLHDEAWPSSGGQRLVKTIDTTAPYDDAQAQGRMKLALGTTLFARGVPEMLMGDEWLEDADFGTDPGNRIDWSKRTTYALYAACVKRMIALRRTTAAFRADRPIQVLHWNEGGNVIGWTRTDAYGNPYLVMANFGNTSYPVYRIGAPRAGGWTQLLNTEAAGYGGAGPDNGPLTTENVAYDGQSQSLVLSLPPHAVLVLRPDQLLAVPGAPAITGGPRIERVAPVPVRDGATVAFTLPATGQAVVDVLDVGGRVVTTLAHGTFAAGAHTLRWSGRDADGRAAAAGVYFVRVRAAGATDVRRVPMVR